MATEVQGYCKFDLEGTLVENRFVGCTAGDDLFVRGTVRKVVPGGLALRTGEKLMFGVTAKLARIVRIEFKSWNADERVELTYSGGSARRREVMYAINNGTVSLDTPFATEFSIARVGGTSPDVQLARVDVIVAATTLTTDAGTSVAATSMTMLNRMAMPDPDLLPIILPSVLGLVLLIACVVGAFVFVRRRRNAVAQAGAAGTPMHEMSLDDAPNPSSTRSDVLAASTYGDAPPEVMSAGESLDALSVRALDADGGTVSAKPSRKKSKTGRATQDLPTIDRTNRSRGSQIADGADWELDPSELELLDEIGRGDFAVVHKARLHGAIVAVKTLRPHDDGLTEGEYAAFKKEARVMTTVAAHANIVRLLGVCTSDPAHFHIVTEFCDGGSLRDRLVADHKARTLDVGQLVRWALECASGVLHLHQSNIVHRDLAARNLLLQGGVVKVADFGLSRNAVEDGNTTKTDTGPLKYMAPESLAEQTYSAKSDVWSYGVVLWELFSGGKMPFEKMTPAQVAMGVVMDRLRLERPRKCPDDVYAVMLECWTDAPPDRPSMQRVLRLLEPIAQAHAVGYEVVPSTPGEPAGDFQYSAPPISLTMSEGSMQSSTADAAAAAAAEPAVASPRRRKSNRKKKEGPPQGYESVPEEIAH
jgi:serine/threonine protein kinase